MWRSKKFIIIAVVAAVVVAAGTMGGVALAQTGSGSTGQTSQTTLMARVAKILGIDQTKLEDAFKQAQTEQRNEALDTYLKKLVTDGKMTQQQADQYKQWWQSKPNVPGLNVPGPGGHMGMRGFGCLPRPQAPQTP